MPDDQLDKVPRRALLKGKGVVTILQYKGPNHFLVLTARDEKV